MKNLNYNYIIAGISNYYSVVYRDLEKKSGIKCYWNYIDGVKTKFVQLLVRVNFNIILNKYLGVPLRYIVYPLIFKNIFNEEKPTCYIFFENQYAVINTSFITYLKKKHVNAKFVLYMQDLVGSLPYYHIDEYKNKFDLILSYDKGDCDRYNLIYNPTPYSKLSNIQLPLKEKSDVYFCGHAKQRLETIFEVYDRCTKIGLKCLFFVTGVSKENQVKKKGIIYNSPISYEENIAYILQTKCVLEIMQEQAIGFTLRLWESITYDKHLLSNNRSIEDSQYYNSDFIHFIKEDEDFSWISNEVNFKEDIKHSLSPIALIEKIDALL